MVLLADGDEIIEFLKDSGLFEEADSRDFSGTLSSRN
jgi:hypothetical protein